MAEKNARINEEALAFTKQNEAGKRAITLQASISSTFPPVLSLKPASSDFVLSNSTVEYVLGGDVPTLVDADEPGVHNLAGLACGLENEFRRHKRRVPRGIDPSEIMMLEVGYIPFVLRVDYVFQGKSVRAAYLYEAYYDGFFGHPPNEYPKGCWFLGKPRLTREIDNTDYLAVMIASFHQWKADTFVEELGVKMPSAFQREPNADEVKKRPSSEKGMSKRSLHKRSAK